MDDANLVERLRRQHVTRTDFGGVQAGAFHKKLVNPDGPEAAARIAALEAENARLRKALGAYLNDPYIQKCGGSLNLRAARALLPDGGDDAG